MATLDNSTNTCRACNAEKPIGEFYLTKGRFGRLYANNTCKTCHSAKVQESKARATADTVEAERRRIWRREHKRKLRAERGCKPRADIAADAAERAEAKARQQAAAKAEKALLRRDANAHVKRWREVLRNRNRHRSKMLDVEFRAMQAQRTAGYRSRPDAAARKADYMREYVKAPDMRVHHRISKHIREAMGGRKARRKWEGLVGYTRQELMDHLERQFLPGMSWSNMDEWHIDHIIPRASLKYDTEDHPNFRACWHITNLRPMWAVDNISKGAQRTTLL